jgi:hypothetical protein
MAVKELEVGMRWAHLTALGEDVAERRKQLGPGVFERKKEQRFRLKCDCGIEFEIWKGDYKGVQHIRDCGCGLADRDGARILFTVSVPLGQRARVRVYAARKGISLSKAWADLTELGLQYDALMQ